MALLTGKVVVVTGAGNGIGRASALALAREGALVVVNDLGCARDGSGSSHDAADAVVAEITAQGGAAVASYASVATAEGAKAIVETARRTFGRLDVLINNAGILRDRALLNMSPETWQAVLDVQLTGTFLCTQAAASVMHDQGGGRIINTTSISGLEGSFGQVNYAAATAAIYGLTRTASIELQKAGIRVNAVAPLAKTRLTEDLPMFARIGDTLSPEHVAPVHVYLASELSGDRTGLIVRVAGARVSVFKLVESGGRYKDEEGGPWTAQEIADHFDAIAKI